MVDRPKNELLIGEKSARAESNAKAAVVADTEPRPFDAETAAFEAGGPVGVLDSPGQPLGRYLSERETHGAFAKRWVATRGVKSTVGRSATRFERRRRSGTPPARGRPRRVGDIGADGAPFRRHVRGTATSAVISSASAVLPTTDRGQGGLLLDALKDLVAIFE